MHHTLKHVFFEACYFPYLQSILGKASGWRMALWICISVKNRLFSMYYRKIISGPMFDLFSCGTLMLEDLLVAYIDFVDFYLPKLYGTLSWSIILAVLVWFTSLLVSLKRQKCWYQRVSNLAVPRSTCYWFVSSLIVHFVYFFPLHIHSSNLSWFYHIMDMRNFQPGLLAQLVACQICNLTSIQGSQVWASVWPHTFNRDWS